MKPVINKRWSILHISGQLKKHGFAVACVAAAMIVTPIAIAQDSSTTSAPASSSSTSTSTPSSSSSPSLPAAIQSLLPPGMTAQQAIDAVKAQAVPNAVPPSQQPTDQVLSPGATPTAAHALPSALETLYASRIGTSIPQFGYDLIANGGTVTAVLNGAIQDTYLLGSGDEVVLTLQGQQNASYTTRVNRDGQIIFPNLPPIPATGREFGDMRRDLETAVNRAYIQTKAYVSIGAIRQVSVRVVGEVANPGVYAVTGLSSVLDALNLAGGIKQSGSLRNITIVRGGSSFTIDLYSMLLTHGRTPDLTIAQGDRIVVPPIGATVAIVGDVRRPAIYELPRGSNAISEAGLIQLGSGPVLRSVYREMILRIRPDGKEEFVDQTDKPGALVRDGEVLYVNRDVNVSLGKVSLQGSVRLPGEFALDRYKTLHDLIPSAEVLAPTPYMLLGVIEHTDPKTLHRALIPFSLLHVLQGRENVNLASGDIVYVLTVDEMRHFAGAGPQVTAQPTPWTQDQSATPGAQPPQSGVAPAVTQGFTATPAIAAPGAPAAAPAASASTPSASGVSALSGLSDTDAAFFGQVLGDYRVTLSGAVRQSGVYLVSPGTTLDEVLAAAGSLDTDADVSSFELTSTLIDNLTGKSSTLRQDYHLPPSKFSTVALRPLDDIYFHHVYTDRNGGTIDVSGEVRYPGSYSLLRGERLSEVLVRAGGLTSVAYPYGTVFLRRSVAEREREGYNRVADEMEQQIVAGMSDSGGTSATGISPEAFAALQGFVNQIRNQKTLGRVSILADPSVLVVHPERDVILEPGDTLYIPPRPSSITVLGDVMQPGSYLFNAKASVDDYIGLAGGYGTDAEQSMTFVVYPDGSAESVDRSWLKFDRQTIPPGSVIYVPRDVFPTRWLPIAINLASILKDLAISAASVAVLSKNN